MLSVGLCWLAVFGRLNFSVSAVIAVVASLIWELSLLLASVSRVWMSELTSLIWLSKASFTT